MNYYIESIKKLIYAKRKQIIFALFAFLCLIDNESSNVLIKSAAPAVVAGAAKAATAAGKAASTGAKVASTAGKVASTGEKVAKTASDVKKGANAANEMIKKHGKPDFISSHGQTVYHYPKDTKVCGLSEKSTLQIGEPSIIAQKTGCPTIANYRTADIAQGGNGAPLVCFADETWFSEVEKYENEVLLKRG